MAAEAAGRGQGAVRGRFCRLRWRPGRARPEPAPATEVERGGDGPERVPGHPPEERARRLEDVQRPVYARRRARGPEEVRRRRAALACGVHGDEDPREDDSAALEDAADGGARTAGSSQRGPRKEGGGDEVAEGAGSEYD